MGTRTDPRGSGTAQSSLGIDCARAVAEIHIHLRDLVGTRSSAGLLIGLSGGVDSAVLATLAVGAVGKERVHAAFLFDRDSERDSARKARVMAAWLGIGLEEQDISGAMKERAVYAPLIMKLVPYSARLNRLIQRLYWWINRETPFKTTLKAGGDALEPGWVKRLMFDSTIRHIERGFSERHIHRRKVLEERARRENLILIGAANLSECEVGWFVKDGIDDLPIQPISGLYKTQVWQLAEHLGLPEEIRAQTPSPDMMRGISDEFGIGHGYRRLDMILDLIDQGASAEAIIARGIEPKELRDVRELRDLAEWKRASPRETPPVSGRIGGNVRL